MKFPNISYSALALMKVRKLQLVEKPSTEIKKSSGVSLGLSYQRFVGK